MIRVLSVLLMAALLGQASMAPRNDLPQHYRTTRDWGQLPGVKWAAVTGIRSSNSIATEPHTIAIDSRGRLFVGDHENNRIEIFDQNGAFLDDWRQFGRSSGIFITRDDAIYVRRSESGPDTGGHELSGIKKGIRIGSAKEGSVTALIEDRESTTPDHSGVEGVGVDSQGNAYGAVVRRQMLERHTRR
jgi:hypothetical protein